ncbi:MAG: TetR/AcrR family transcriptional regulator, partial [Daejeonella sp.]
DQSTEQKILQAARKVFISSGMAGARMQDIANEAEINKALLHYYFRSKEKLFDTVFKEVSGNLFPKINSIFEADISLFEKIEQFCEAYIEKLIENPFIPLFVLNEMNRNPEAFAEKILGGKKPNLKIVFTQVQENIKQGIIKSIKPEHLFMNMISMCIFPFVAKPMYVAVSGAKESDFLKLMQERKTEIPKFIIDSIRK